LHRDRGRFRKRPTVPRCGAARPFSERAGRATVGLSGTGGTRMARILVVYGTREGQTARIAARIAERMRSAGHEVDAYNLAEVHPHPRVEGYDAVLVGASVHSGGFEKEVRRWVGDHADQLSSRRNAFFTVSLSAVTHDETHDKQIADVVDYFVEHTDWRPMRVVNFAGALQYSKYNWFLKRIMRRIVRKEAGERYTDMTHDYDLTRWEAVDVFADEFAQTVAASDAAQ
jgi:menaquinone-dependent protoporphyrinogen oxidase